MALTMMSQAGVALGLALETKTRFPRWGDDFATLMLAVVVLNQLIGPPLCKIGLTRLCAAGQNINAPILPGLRDEESGATKGIGHDSHDLSSAVKGDSLHSVTTLHRPVVRLQSPSSYLASAKSIHTQNEDVMRQRPGVARHGSGDWHTEGEAAVLNADDGAREPSISVHYSPPTLQRMLTRSSSAYASLARSPHRPQRSSSARSATRSDTVFL